MIIPHSQTFSNRRTPGFTLVELLVVVSVIALMVGLLLPALSSARRRAQATVCISNIRQLALANIAYTNEYDGRLAPGASAFSNNLDRWHGRRTTIHERFVPEDGPLSDMLGPGGRVRDCPSFDPDRSKQGTDFESGNGGYGYNNIYLGVDERKRDTQGIRYADIARTMDTVMFTDAGFAQAFPTLRVIEYSFTEPPVQRRYPEYTLDPSIHFRHANGTTNRASVAWTDGHVNSMEFSFTHGNVYGVTESQMRALHLGWFGKELELNRFFDLE